MECPFHFNNRGNVHIRMLSFNSMKSTAAQLISIAFSDKRSTTNTTNRNMSNADGYLEQTCYVPGGAHPDSRRFIRECCPRKGASKTEILRCSLFNLLCHPLKPRLGTKLFVNHPNEAKVFWITIPDGEIKSMTYSLWHLPYQNAGKDFEQSLLFPSNRALQCPNEHLHLSGA